MFSYLKDIYFLIEYYGWVFIYVEYFRVVVFFVGIIVNVNFGGFVFRFFYFFRFFCLIFNVECKIKVLVSFILVVFSINVRIFVVEFLVINLLWN